MSQNTDYAELLAQAEKAVAAMTDPELKRIAFEKILGSAQGSNSFFDGTSRMVQVLSVVVGVIISALSFVVAQQSEANTRMVEAEARKLEVQKYNDSRADEAAKRQTEAAKPFLELRQKTYLDAVATAGVLANPDDHTKEELDKARKRFRELYVAELSLVEGNNVEQGMMNMASYVDPKLRDFSAEQLAAYNLAHALRDSLVKSWGLSQELVDNPNK